MTLSEIKKITNAVVYPKIIDGVVSGLVIDSRKVFDVTGSLFIALNGTFRDGHQFIGEAYAKGVRYFLISDKPKNSKQYPDATFLIVQDTNKALQQIATAHRNQFQLPIIGITGSNGKTIVKEWLFQLLSESWKIVRNPKSYNSQIGVPLSLWQISEENNLGLFEAGISQPEEMGRLEKMIQPNWGLFTNIGDAHSNGFKSQEQKIKEKLLLFHHSEKLFYCRDHTEIHNQLIQFQKQIHVTGQQPLSLCAWSRNTKAPLEITQVKVGNNKTQISAVFDKRTINISVPFEDEAAIENAIHCWNIMLHLGLSDDVISKKMSELHAVSMRLESVSAINHSMLINDTYNSDLTSLKIALDTLSIQRQTPSKTIILSDLLQTSIASSDLYSKIAHWIHKKDISRFIGIGSEISKFKKSFRQYKELQSFFFLSTDEFLKSFSEFSFNNEAILLKGARAFKFEKIARLLEQKIHKTVLEINLSALANNLKVYKKRLPEKVKIMAMVKAFSYGSGSYEIAQVLQDIGVDCLAVAYVDEGVALRKAGIQLPIMVMSPEAGTYERMIFWNLEPEIFSLESLDDFQKAVVKLNKKSHPIHLKLDTGMHRLGFVQEDIAMLKERLKNNSFIKVVSIFSHLSASGAKKFDNFTNLQADIFSSMANEICNDWIEKPILHLLNSAGIARHPKYYFDMVRLGIGLYGIDTSNILQDELINIGTLKSTIAQIKELEPGAFVGYDLKERIEKKSRIATVNIGYADGYFRDFGNRNSYMIVHGQKAPVVGSVCMDMCMLDITNIQNVKAGDEVIVFGESPHINQLAQWANTIPYEIMVGISQRVNRVYVNE